MRTKKAGKSSKKYASTCLKIIQLSWECSLTDFSMKSIFAVYMHIMFIKVFFASIILAIIKSKCLLYLINTEKYTGEGKCYCAAENNCFERIYVIAGKHIAEIGRMPNSSSKLHIQDCC